MPRAEVRSTQFDFRGGLNSNFSEDVLNENELRNMQNARAKLGDLEKRAGTQRLHTTVLGSGAPVCGVYQWDAPLGKQLVAIAGGNFYHKLAAAANYTQIASTLTTTDRATFTPYRIGGNVKLLIADKALRTWDGTTLVTAIAGAPAADRAIIYKLRAFAIDGTKTMSFSKIGDPTLWSVANGGGTIDIETYDDAQNMALMVLGSSLLIAKRNNVARFTGVDTSNIRVDVETEGVSGEVGCIAPNTFVRFDEYGFMLSDRGPYIVTEAGVKEIGLKVAKGFDFGDRSLWQSAQATHNRRRKEIWLTCGAPSDADTVNKYVWIYNYTTSTWSGPFLFSWPGVITLGRYQRTDDTESIQIGGQDGYVRDGDVEEVGSVDDVLKDGTGGSSVTMDVQLPDVTAGAPERVKSMRGKNELVADLGAAAGEASAVTAYWTSELGSGSVPLVTLGAGVRTYRYKLSAKGARIVHGFTSASKRMIRILGVLPKSKISRGVRS